MPLRFDSWLHLYNQILHSKLKFFDKIILVQNGQ